MRKVGIIAPSGCVDNLNGVCEFFNLHGVDAVIYPSCYEKFRYMAGADEIRLNDLHNAFSDPSIDTIICARGGYGAIRLLDKIDYDLISKNKKTFVGFSDITVLLIALYKNAGLKGFHGKMAVNGVSKMGDDEFIEYKNALKYPHYKTSLTGGILWGGNLASIVTLFGSGDYLPKEDIILFVEDVNEPDYKIDRMFQQILRNKPLKDKIKGVIFGEFAGAGEYLYDIQKEFAEALFVPYETDLNITHGKNNKVVPFGFAL